MIELVLTENYYTFKKLEERLNMLRRDMYNIKKSQTSWYENKMSQIKNTLDLINDWLDITDKIRELKDVAIETLQNETEKKEEVWKLWPLGQIQTCPLVSILFMTILPV